INTTGIRVRPGADTGTDLPLAAILLAPVVLGAYAGPLLVNLQLDEFVTGHQPGGGAILHPRETVGTATEGIGQHHCGERQDHHRNEHLDQRKAGLTTHLHDSSSSSSSSSMVTRPSVSISRRRSSPLSLLRNSRFTAVASPLGKKNTWGKSSSSSSASSSSSICFVTSARLRPSRSLPVSSVHSSRQSWGSSCAAKNALSMIGSKSCASST